MIRVLFLIPDLGHGGAERVLVNLVNHLDRERFDVTVMTLFDQGVNKKYLNEDVRYKSASIKQFRGYSRIIAYTPATWLYRWIVKEPYDIVVSYLEGACSKIISGCPYPETKKVAWIHIELDSARRLSAGFRGRLDAVKAYARFDKIICVADTVKQTFLKTAREDFPQVQVLYNTNETDTIRRKALEIVDDVVFSSDTINVCSVAKLMHSKGYDRLIRVHKRLLEEGLRHHIYILGVGEEESKLKHFAEHNDLTDTFTLLGFRDNPYPYVKAADVYICSSRREGFSTAITESLIVGTPVVTTCCSGAYELLGEKDPALTQEENGKYELCTCGIVTENSEQGIYEGLKRMLQDASLRELYAKRAYERGQYFSTEQTVSAVEKMLVELYEEN